MKKRVKKQHGEDLRLNPEQRLCPAFDDRSIKQFDLPQAQMGFRVVDNCAEENIQ